MKKVYNSLQTKLIASFVLLILVIAGGTLLITLRETRQPYWRVHEMISGN